MDLGTQSPPAASPGTLLRLSASATRVLLGDSAPSELPSNILDTIVEVCLFARDVSIAHEDTTELWRQLEAAEHSFSEISEQLQRFRRMAESGLRVSVKDATRDEMKEHGQQAIESLGAQVDGWLAHYKAARDAQVADLRRQIEALHKQMHASLDRFALPLRAQPKQRLVRRTYDAAKGHEDIARLELLPGLRGELQFEDTESEQPRRLRSMVGKGLTLQVGTKKALLRRTEEPAHVSLDDLLILSAEVTPDQVKLDLAKKAAGPVTLRVALTRSGELIAGRGVLPEGGGNALPDEDEPTMHKVWDAMQAESTRIIASPARSLRYALRDELVDSPAGYVNVAERVLQHYRPMVRTIMEHSPNDEELTVKVEFGERREEKWIQRKTLAEHLGRVPAAFSERLSLPEVLTPRAELASPSSKIASPPPKPAKSDPDEEKATRAYAAVPVELRPPNPEEDTQDISLTDLDVQEIEDEDGDEDDDIGEALEALEAKDEGAEETPAELENVAGEIETASSGGLPLPALGDSPKRVAPKKPPPPAGLRRPKR